MTASESETEPLGGSCHECQGSGEVLLDWHGVDMTYGCFECHGTGQRVDIDKVAAQIAATADKLNQATGGPAWLSEYVKEREDDYQRKR